MAGYKAGIRVCNKAVDIVQVRRTPALPQSSLCHSYCIKWDFARSFVSHYQNHSDEGLIIGCISERENNELFIIGYLDLM